MSKLRPTVALRNLADVNADQFWGALPEETFGITWDLDSTLVDHYDRVVPYKHLELLAGLAELGVPQAIISNAGKDRVERVQRLAGQMSRYMGDEMAVVTSYEVGAKKPKTAIFAAASSKLDIRPSRLVHVGDQLLKDVLGANLAGYAGSVLVAPYGNDADWRVKHLQRPLEAGLRPFLGLPAMVANFPTTPVTLPSFGDDLERVYGAADITRTH